MAIENHPTESHAKAARNSKPDGKNWVLKPRPGSRQETQLIDLGRHRANKRSS